MRLLDRILFFSAAISLAGIVAIFAVSEPGKPIRNSFIHDKEDKVAAEPLTIVGDPQEMLVLNKEADDLIEKYFENIRNNPEKGEEDERMVGSDDETSGLNSGSSASQQTLETAPREKFAGYRIISHTVKKGESIWRIAQTYGVPVYTIVSANPSKKNSSIHPGEVLKVPDRAGVLYKVSSKDSLSSIAKKFKVDKESLVAVNGLQSSVIAKGEEIFISGAKPLPEVRYKVLKRFAMPIVGRFTSPYGWRTHPIFGDKRFHSGLDIGAKYGTPIRAAADGVVVSSGDGGSYGNLVILRHKDNYFTIYAHCSKVLVKEGTFVKRGKRIALVGSTGIATGPHLHFEVKKGKKFLSPLAALKEKVRVPIKKS